VDLVLEALEEADAATGLTMVTVVAPNVARGFMRIAAASKFTLDN
jgi:hypothetical protein